jgi:DNA replication protein DnaC
LPTQLRQLNLRATAEQLDDIVARATRQRLAPRVLLEELAQRELVDHAQRNLQRLLAQARLGRFRPMADFDWHWPKKIDRRLIERALTLEFLTTQRNLILLGANGLGKTMIAKHIAFAAVPAGHRATVSHRVGNPHRSELRFPATTPPQIQQLRPPGVTGD